MPYEDPDYAINQRRFKTRMGAISLLSEIYNKTHSRQKAGRLVRRASYPCVGRPPRHPVQSDSRLEIFQFSELLDDFRADYEDLYAPADLNKNLIEGFETLGFWHFYSRFPENQRLQRLHNLYQRYFYLLLPDQCLPYEVVTRRIDDDDFHEAITLERFSLLVWGIVNHFSELPGEPSDPLRRVPKHRTWHKPLTSSLKKGRVSRKSLQHGSRVRFGSALYRKIPKGNLGVPIRDLWTTLLSLNNRSMKPPEKVEIFEQRVNIDYYSGKDDENEKKKDSGYEGDDESDTDEPIQSSKFGPTDEMVDRRLLQPIDKYFESMRQLEEIYPKKHTTPSSHPLARQSHEQHTRADTPHPKKRSAAGDGNPEKSHSVNGALAPASAEADVSLPRPLRKAHQILDILTVDEMWALTKAFCWQEVWPAISDIYAFTDKGIKEFSIQIGTQLQFGDNPPHEILFDGTKWVRKPGVRSGKRRWKAVTNHRGKQAKGSEMLSRFIQWDAKKNLIRLASKHTPLPATEWSNSKGKTPNYRADEQLSSQRWTDDNGGIPAHKKSRIDSVVASCRKASIDRQTRKRKREVRRWVVDTKAGTLKRLPSSTAPDLSRPVDKRNDRLAVLEINTLYRAIEPDLLRYLELEYGMPASQLAAVLKAPIQLGVRLSWKPFSTRERIPRPFDPFLAANLTRAHIKVVRSIETTQTAPALNTTIPSLAGSMIRYHKSSILAQEQNETLQRGRVLRKSREPELAGTITLEENVSELCGEVKRNGEGADEGERMNGSPAGVGSEGSSTTDHDSQSDDTDSIINDYDAYLRGGIFETGPEHMSVNSDPSDHADSDGGLEGWRSQTRILRARHSRSDVSCRRRRGPVTFPWTALRGGAANENEENEHASSSSENEESNGQSQHRHRQEAPADGHQQRRVVFALPSRYRDSLHRHPTPPLTPPRPRQTSTGYFPNGSSLPVRSFAWPIAPNLPLHHPSVQLRGQTLRAQITSWARVHVHSVLDLALDCLFYNLLGATESFLVPVSEAIVCFFPSAYRTVPAMLRIFFRAYRFFLERRLFLTSHLYEAWRPSIPLPIYVMHTYALICRRCPPNTSLQILAVLSRRPQLFRFQIEAQNMAGASSVRSGTNDEGRDTRSSEGLDESLESSDDSSSRSHSPSYPESDSFSGPEEDEVPVGRAVLGEPPWARQWGFGGLSASRIEEIRARLRAAGCLRPGALLAEMGDMRNRRQPRS